MYETHKDSQGMEILIAEMEDSHLTNTISLLCRRIAQAISVINSDPEEQQVDKVIAHLQPKYSAERIRFKAEKDLVEIDKKLSAYIVEAVVRGMNVSAVVQGAYQRNTQIGGRRYLTGDDFDSSKLIK